MGESDERYTPQWLLDLVTAYFGRIDVDPCYSPDSLVEAEFTFDREEDGLRHGWSLGVEGRRAAGLCDGPMSAYVNPPYSRGQVERWVRKAWRECSGGDVRALVLTQADVSTQWFAEARRLAQAVCFLGKRVGFVKADGTALPGAKFGSALWLFHGRQMQHGRPGAQFYQFWSPHGWVVQL